MWGDGIADRDRAFFEGTRAIRQKLQEREASLHGGPFAFAKPGKAPAPTAGAPQEPPRPRQDAAPEEVPAHGPRGGDVVQGADLADAAFRTGDRVEVVGLQSHPALNGLRGTLVSKSGIRWQVAFDDGSFGEKLMRAKNLQRVGDIGTAAGAGAVREEQAAMPRQQEGPARCFVVGTWTDWAPCEMSWDPDRQCYQVYLELGSEGTESFQIWIDADPGKCLYPEYDLDSLRRTDGDPTYTIHGPDDGGHDKNWVIMGEPQEPFYEVRLFVQHDGTVKGIDWVKVPRPTLAPPPPAGTAAAQPLAGARQDVPPAGKPQPASLPAAEPSRAAPQGGSAAAQGEAVGHSSASSVARAQFVPAQAFEVVHESVPVHEKPALDAPALGRKARGDVVSGVRETFDGWVKLDAAPGWILKDMRGRGGVGRTLSPVGAAPALVVEEPADAPGPQRFRVSFQPHVEVRVAPAGTAKLQGIRGYGEEVLAEAQTYNGWIKLVSRGGWIQCFDPDHGKLLRCVSLEGRNPQRSDDSAGPQAALADLVASDSPDKLEEAIRLARRKGTGEEELQAAEARLAEMRRQLAMDNEHMALGLRRLFGLQFGSHDREAIEAALIEGQALRQRLRRRIERAGNDEKELRECAEACTAAGFLEDAQHAQRLLKKLSGKHGPAGGNHARLLEEFAAATASGDLEAIRSARDAAKRGGVSAKELSRIFALHK